VIAFRIAQLLNDLWRLILTDIFSANSAAAGKSFAKPSGEHVSLGGGLRSTLLWIPLLLLAGIILVPSLQASQVPPLGGILFLILAAFLWNILVSGIRVSAQWERGVVLFLGSLRGIRGPGLFYIIPILEYVRFVDTRTSVINIPRQKVITRDNVPADIDGALFFRVANPARAITVIEDFRFAIAQYAQAALRDVVGGLTLDELLSERERIQTQIVRNIEVQIQEWGLHVDSVQLQDLELPEDLKRMMSREASAEREKRATITKAEGDKLAAENLAEAAMVMAENPISLELRALQTIDGLGASPSNTVILFPVELVNLLRRVSNASHASNGANPGDQT
jgi:regulator of protease activity HflC (stomatin/prohibitin superfamily)